MEFHSILIFILMKFSIYYAHVVSGGCEHGELISHETDCHHFYHCVWGEKQEQECPSSLVFNNDKKVCDWPQDPADPCNNGGNVDDGSNNGGDSSNSDLMPCSEPHCLIYKAKFSTCTEVTRAATYDCRWKANFDRRIDEKLLKGTIVAYQIQWFNGDWSDWYSPSHNDIDHKINPTDVDCEIPIYADSLRRMWAYFFDHTHKYIICK